MREGKKYKHVIFDLDHTLWDFTTNSNETLKELYVDHNLEEYYFSLNDFQITYHLINEKMWYDYHRNLISKAEIRDKRFVKTFDALGVKNNDLAQVLNEKFLAICPAKGNLIAYAKEALQYLSPRYTLHILTNGFKESQNIKITTSGISNYFKEVINSETCGYLKPHKKIFEYTLSKIEAHVSDCIMIGDDLLADVIGAKNCGIDQVFFNIRGLSHKEEPTYEIKCLSELKKIL